MVGCGAVMNSPRPCFAILVNSDGIEVERHRTDCMNFDAFTWIVADARRRHGLIEVRLEEIPADGCRD